MVVGADGKVAARPVKTGDAQGNNWIVTDGLNAGDTVIVEGLQKVKPGAPVKTTQWNANAPAGNAPAGVAQANGQK
jgi:membrane fusion protein (multidrug efflux system)